MASTSYTVQGMTCDHCARAVTEEVAKIDGVTDVRVDVPAGQVTVTSSSALPVESVREAVDEAGYELVSSGG